MNAAFFHAVNGRRYEIGFSWFQSFFVPCKNCAGRLYLEIGYHISLVNPLQDSRKAHEAITY